MRLDRQMDELIQDYVDGNLSQEKRAQVQQLIESNPQVRESTEQYRLVTKSLVDLEPTAVNQQFADAIMARLPGESWWVALAKRDSLSLFAVLSIAAALVWLVDLSAVTGWLNNSLLPNFSVVSFMSDSVVQVSERLNGVLPYLGFSLLVISFYGLLDRIIGSYHRTTRA